VGHLVAGHLGSHGIQGEATGASATARARNSHARDRSGDGTGVAWSRMPQAHNSFGKPVHGPSPSVGATNFFRLG